MKRDNRAFGRLRLDLSKSLELAIKVLVRMEVVEKGLKGVAA